MDSRRPFLLALLLALASSALVMACDSGTIGPVDAGADDEPDPPSPGVTNLQVETLVSGLDTPWDLAWGPDGAIWFTERAGRVSRVDPSGGEVTVVGEIEVEERGESGLMGMAFHPDFETTPYVYFVYSYEAFGGEENRLIRMRYQAGVLMDAETLVDQIPGNVFHDGSRLTVGPDRLLYFTMGDAGDQDAAQDLESLSGKVLRVTLEGAPAPENPFDSYVYSYGHRNPQGIVFNPLTGDLYVAEHGPGDNDELMLVVEGGDHGWPSVHGFCDADVGTENDYCDSHEVVEPLRAWTPTIGISGLDYYGSDLIPGWRESLLVTSLIGETLWRLELLDEGTSLGDFEEILGDEYGRLRDVMVAPDGTVYVATSNRDGRGQAIADDDRILKITPAT